MAGNMYNTGYNNLSGAYNNAYGVQRDANNALALDRMDIAEDIDTDDVLMQGNENYSNGGTKTPSRTPQKTPSRKTHHHQM